MQGSTNSEISELTSEEKLTAYETINLLEEVGIDLGNLKILMKAGRIIEAYEELDLEIYKLGKSARALQEFVKILRAKNFWKD